MIRLSAIALASLALAAAPAQTTKDYAIGVSVIQGHHPGCPVFLRSIQNHSPAQRAGLQAGDVLVAVDGVPVATVDDAVRRIGQHRDAPVKLSLQRGDAATPLSAVLQPEEQATILRKNGWKMIDGGRLVPLPTTDAEIACLLQVDSKRAVARVFQPTHYPADLRLYYPGFEAFLLDRPQQLMVGGMELGPAADAGMRWGDIVVSIDGTSVAGKTSAEVEHMLSSRSPRKITIAVERCGHSKTFSFRLEPAGKILRRNQQKVIGSAVMPLGIPEKYLSCFN